MSEKIIEEIEFLTQIHTAWDDTEQRMALRGCPRRYISYEYIGVNNTQSQYLRALTSSTQTQILQFPLWHANRVLQKGAYKGQSIIALSKDDMWNYRDCSGAMFWSNDEEGGEYIKLQNVTADGVLHLGKQLVVDFPAHKTIVVPVFWGILQQEDKYTNLTSELTNMVINVEFINRGLNIEMPEAINEFNYPRLIFPECFNAPNDYLGHELFVMPPTWNENISSNYKRNANRLDNQTGVIRYDLKSTAPAEVRGMEYTAIRLSEVQYIQRFFYRCKGRLKSFYAPTWLDDIELIEDVVGGNILLVKFQFYWKYYTLNKRRNAMMIFFHDGMSQILKIAGFSLDNTKKCGKIFLDQPIKTSLRRNQIRMISFLCLYRFNSDKLITDYETTTSANINLEFTEVSD